MSIVSFKERPLSERKLESSNILRKYPNKIPIILEKYDKNSPDLDRYKYLVSYDTTVAVLLLNIRKRTKINYHQSLYLFVNGEIYNVSTMISEIYEKNKNEEDNFLYFTYSTENTFGGF